MIDFERLKKIIESLPDFLPTYSLVLKSFTIDQISSAPFHGKEVFDWCKECGKGAICGHCPSEKNDFNQYQKERIKRLREGILLIIKVPPEELAGEIAFKENRPAKTQRLVKQALEQIREEVSIKHCVSEFFLLGAGPCKLVYCSDEKCQLLDIMRYCKYPLESFYCAECCGVNVFETVANLGEKVHYIDRNTDPTTVPYGSRVGFVLYK